MFGEDLQRATVPPGVDIAEQVLGKIVVNRHKECRDERILMISTP